MEVLIDAVVINISRARNLEGSRSVRLSEVILENSQYEMTWDDLLRTVLFWVKKKKA